MLPPALGLDPFPLTSVVIVDAYMPTYMLYACSINRCFYLFCYRTQLRTNDYSSIQRDYLLLLH